MASLVNLTPHPIVLRSSDGSDLTIAPRSLADGGPARVASTPGEKVGDANGIPIYGAPAWGEVVGLSAPVAETIYIVSALVLERCAGREDVVGPGTDLCVTVRNPETTHHVTPDQIRRWCDGVAVSPDEVLKRHRVKQLIG